MQPNTPNEIEAIVEAYRNINMPAELLAILGNSRMTLEQADKIDDFVTNWLRTTLTQLKANRTAEMSAMVREEREFAYKRAIEACELNDTVHQVKDDIEQIIRRPDIYE